MLQVRLISGGSRSDRAPRIDALILERLDESLLIVPTSAHARQRAAAILAQTKRGALLHPPVVTFGEFVTRILQASSLRTRRIETLEQRIFLGRAIARARAGDTLNALGDAADSEGFLDHVLGVIGQIKQAAIEPGLFEKRVRGRRHAMDAVVAAIYTAYQDELQRAGVVDLPGMYWLARIECESKTRPAGFGNVRQIIFDDFDDFTPSEFDVVKALAPHLDALQFGINLSADPEQKSLYAVPLRTVARIREQFDSVEVPDTAAEPKPARISEFIGSSLFVRKDVPVPDGLRRDVSFFECHTVEHEIETIARRIKHLVRQTGTPLPRIAVVYRKLAPFREPLHEIFREFGIPLAGLEAQTLADSAAAGFVLRFLEAAQAWSPEAVLDVLTSPWFAGPAAHHAAFPILLRAARVPSTRSGWRATLERLARYLDDPQQLELRRLSEHIPLAREASTALMETVDRFSKQSEPFTRAKTVAQYIDGLLTLLGEWSMHEAVAAMPPTDERDREEAALTALTRTLAIVRNGYTAENARVEPSRFAQILRSAFAVSSFSTSTRDGAVACVDMEAARYLEFDYVFLAGLTDAQLPANRTLNAIYTDDERAGLTAAGVPIDRADVHSQREVLLFQRMFATARQGLFASWHRLAHGGATVQRSLYLNEIADRLGGLSEQQAESPGEVLVPSAALAGCERDIQNLVVPKRETPHFARIDRAAKMERSRYSLHPFDQHDGVLSETSTRTWLGAQYGAAHVYSASQLEAYAECPFRFFQERILDLLAIEPPEQAFDHLARGLVLHGALERFHRNYAGKIIDEIPHEEAHAFMAACAGESFDEIAVRFRNLTPGVLSAERARITAALQRYLRLQREPKKNAPEPWPPSEFEVAFGHAGNESGRPAFALQLDSGEFIHLAGRIDRIDRRDGQLRLVDYKSSAVKPKELKEGRVFQLALYALATEAMLFPGEQCEDAIYIPIGRDENPAVALSRANSKAPYEERVALAREAVAKAVAGIRSGTFHPTQDETHCSGCLRQKVCRFERNRVRKKEGL